MFLLPEKFAYLFLCLPFAILYIVILYLNTDHREVQLKMSLIGAVFGPLSEIIHFADYWMPKSVFYIQIGNFPFMVEDVIFGFLALGIASVVFDVLFEHTKVEFQIPQKQKNTFIIAVLIFLISGFIFLTLGINSVITSSFSMLLTGLFILYKRRDLMINAVLSAVGFLFIVFVVYSIFLMLVANIELILKDSWFLYGTSLGVRLLRVPVTELLWAFSTGFLFGPLYKFIKNTSYYF